MNASLARFLYSALLRLATPFYLFSRWRRGKVEPLYRHALAERFAFYSSSASSGWLWIHAVSLGETRAAAPLIAALRERQPDLRLLLSCSTATGREAGRELLRDGDAQCWLPFDTPGAVQRFFRHWQPRLGVLMETEIWPNLLHHAPCPMVLANARLSEKSARQGRRFAALLHPAALRITLALAQTEADAARMRETGAPEVRVMGNLKYDLQPDDVLVARGRAWREQVGRPVLLFAVSREGEEAMFLQAWLATPQAHRPLLAIVPRHPQRFDEVADLIRAAGLKLARRSSWADTPDAAALAADAWLGDSMREMPLYYGLADVALLGGSFAPLGGQNLIEAAACACPVVMGPHTFNFSEAAQLAKEAGAAQRVSDMAEGLTAAMALCDDAAMRQQRAESARRFAAAHRGAAARMATALLSLVR